MTHHNEVPVTKDSNREGPIPSAWRPVLMRDYIQDYRARLVELPPQSWDTSVCIWMGDHWDALIDLWTEDEGRSDLVLDVKVSEAGSGYLVDIHMVYVP